MQEADINILCDRVNCLRYTLLFRSVYENALAHRLRKTGMDVKQQYPLSVFDEDGTLVGDYFTDLLLESTVIVEMKAAKSLAVEHEAQILAYLRSARLEHRLLMNFGSPKFEIRKFPGVATDAAKFFCVLCVLCG